MKNLYLPLLCLILTGSAFAQTRIDTSMQFQIDPSKDYSIYIPSSYDANTPNKLMLGLHPFNTNRWWAASWCDTLIDFAEANDLILICPDGGSDGQVDDPIDTAFTTFLLDSMSHWYNIDEDKVYAMGFSWGGLTTYTYGLNHVNRFGGFMPIGAAVSTNDVTGIIQNAEDKAFYLVHGGNDSPNNRYSPLLLSLDQNNAITNSILMPGVGHTIDFANRNDILTDAFVWIDSVNCAQLADTNDTSTNVSPITTNPIQGLDKIFPTVVQSGSPLTANYIMPKTGTVMVRFMEVSGRVVSEELHQVFSGKQILVISTKGLAAGNYLIEFTSGDHRDVAKVTVTK